MIDQGTSEGYYSYSNATAAVVDVMWLSWLTLRVLKALAGDFCAFLLAPLGISRINLKKYGSWAVVTGASCGIGRGYALELARQGLNVVIMSRSEDKLQKVAEEIKEKYGHEVRIISVDFSKGCGIYPNLAEQMQGLDVGILVNNVGITYEYPDYFNEVDTERLHNLVEVNCQSMVQMTKLLLPKMLEKKRGIVVNISSSAGTMNMPMHIVYSATKCFINSFSEGLRKEYADKGIIVQCVVPFLVVTSVVTDWGVKQATLWTADSVRYARAAVATIGIKSFTRGYYPHALLGYFYDHIPSFVTDWIFVSFLKKNKACCLQRKVKEK